SPLLVRQRVQRSAHPRDQPGDLPLSQKSKYQRSSLPRDGHACALGPGVRQCARSAGCQRGRDDGDSEGGYTPTAALSHAILTYNRGRKDGLADGIVITPSHNPPCDGGFKYNPSNGGPADSTVTDWIQNTANEFLKAGLAGVLRVPYERARTAATVHQHDYIGAYVGDLGHVVDMESI